MNFVKKHNSFNDHVMEVTAGIIRVAKQDTLTNLADPLSELMPYCCRSF